MVPFKTQIDLNEAIYNLIVLIQKAAKTATLKQKRTNSIKRTPIIVK